MLEVIPVYWFVNNAFVQKSEECSQRTNTQASAMTTERTARSSTPRSTGPGALGMDWMPVAMIDDDLVVVC